MGVYLHKNSPNWQYEFQHKGTRYRGSTSCTSKSAAKEYERKERNRIAEGAQERPDITLDEAFGNYWTLVGQHESNSVTTAGQIKRMTTFFGKNTLLRDLDRAEIDKYVSRRRRQKARNKTQPVSNATVNRETQLLKRVIARVPDRFAKPTINWKGVNLKESQERVRELSTKEEARLFEVLPPDLANVAEFAILTGQRLSSVITLLWSKVDLEAGRAELRVKGDKWHRIPLIPRAVALVRSQVRAGPYVFTYLCERPSPPRKDRVRRLRGERYPFTKDGWRRKWKVALEAAGIEDFRFHDFRHTGATRVLRASKNLKAVQNLLGHATITTTARYAHALEDDVRDALSAVESRNNAGATISELPGIRRNARGGA